MHVDLLDTVLVSRKEMSSSGSPGAAPMNGQPSTDDEAKCPVDHKTRETWLKQARANAADGAQDPHAGIRPVPAAVPTAAQPSQSPWSWSSWRIPFLSGSAPTSASTTAPASAATHTPALDTDRVISSIPRSSTPGPTSCPVNHEQETGASASGNWIYPSEKMFFDAMQRKGFSSAAATDMKTVVPIHNAVNERAWAEILQWEAPYSEASKACGGPRLHSFAGVSEKMTPRARMNTLLGYTSPFDRHDWVVDRCGTKVEYVIDFYAGRQDGGGKGKVNFYLDVRPKLNSWEGVKMRAMKTLGLV